MKSEVSIHLIVKDGEKYIKECLEAVKNQTYPNIKTRVFDNSSGDKTVSLAKEVMPSAEVICFSENYFVGGAFNRSVELAEGSDYIVMLCVDVIMEERFIERAVQEMEKDKKIGVLQAKVFYYDYENKNKTDVIDTTGMVIYRSRRIINRGHGDKDSGRYDKAEEIFLYEGAVPFFRSEALEDAKMPIKGSERSEYLDEDFIWYADEVDLGWRMRLLGWKCWYCPEVIAWHDRSTTHFLSSSFGEFIKQRRLIPAHKRMLDFRNQRFAFIKNDRFFTFIRHIFYIARREAALFIYFIVFERSSLAAYIHLISKFPLMFKKRKAIARSRRVSEKEIRRWFI